MRKATKRIRIGNKYIGGGEPILVQSMTNTKTDNIMGTVIQIKALEEAGCDIIRVAVPDSASAAAIKAIKKSISIPIVADIHFDYRLAIEAINNGADKIRINPGNIGDSERLKKVIETAKQHDISIRIGVNSGSLEKELVQKYGAPTSDALVESVMRSIQIIEGMNFENIVIAVKSSNVPLSIESYIKISEKSNYPLHLGITEAGTSFSGTIKSSIGIGALLYMGIGDTIRVSLTGDPVEEALVGKEILKSLNLITGGIEVISCPTCGRCNVDLISTAKAVEKAVRPIKTSRNIKVAVMGCAVNGPGEAREADIGVAGGKGEFLIFVNGKVIRKVSQEQVINELISEIYRIIN